MLSRPLLLFFFLPLYLAFFLTVAAPSASAQGFSDQSSYRGWKNFSDYSGPAAMPETLPEQQLARPPSPARSNRAVSPVERHNQDERHNRETESQTEKPRPSSPLEKAYADRIVDEPRQFGYGMFAGGDSGALPSSFALPAGMAQERFILNSGDTLNVRFRGQRKGEISATIGSDGYLIIDDLPPIAAAGNSIGYVRALLESHVAQMHNTEVYVSLSGVRQINVLIIGHVKKPGRKVMTVFHTALDALIEAGGIEKTGSLRQIKLIRNGRSTIIDLYGLLVHGSDNMDLSLRDGDRLVIPPIGPTVAVTGGVKRPGIYEILPALKGMRHKPAQASQTLSLQDMLDFAGGTLSAGQNRFLKLGLTQDGRETVEEISDSFAPVFSDSAILMVMTSDEKRAGTIELSGHTRRPGLHALSTTPSLSALLDGEQVLGPDIYPLIAVIERWDENMMATRLTAFSPRLVLKGDYDERLKDGDVIHLFSRTQILSLDDRELYAENATDAVGSIDAPLSGRDDVIADSLMRSFLKDHTMTLRGAVRQEGLYPVTAQTSLEEILAIAGGLTLEADKKNIELTARNNKGNDTASGSSQDLLERQRIDLTQIAPATIRPGTASTVRVNKKFQKIIDNSVLIIGEVKNPGRYDLMPGDKLSDLITRAGGITAQAYPEGAIFSREQARRAEEARFRAQAQDLELKLGQALRQKEEPELQQIEAVQKLITQLKNAEALGRITVEADPNILEVKPELDLLLEKGDRIYIPKRPLTVRVSGEVLSPASLQFRSSKTAEDYINEAGGMTHHADKKRTFVLYPDGSAQPLVSGPWNSNPVLIPPGSTVVVPHDPEPFNFIQTAKDVTQILTNIAITGIFIEDIRD